MKRLFNRYRNNNNFLSLFGQIIFSLLGFVSYVVAARSFNKIEFGEWVLYITTSSFIEMIRFGLTKTAVIRFLSGAAPEERKKIIGANYQLGLISTLILINVIALTFIIFHKTIYNSGFTYFFIWYPLLAIVNLPFNNALTILQADLKFKELLYIRSFNIGSFVLMLVLNLFFFKWSLYIIILIHIFINLLTGIICMLYKWDGLSFFYEGNMDTNKKIFHFGKFTTGSLIGNNLLKSSDTFIIGLSSILGASAVAMYSIPLKLTELLEIPIRSYSATLLPKLSKDCIEDNIHEVRMRLYKYTGILSFAYVIICLLGFIFSDNLIVMMAGKNYISGSLIFKVFCIYSLLLPIEKFSGVALDSINMPQKNFNKIAWMTAINVVGNLIAVFYFKSLLLTSVVSVVMTLAGAIIGLHYLNKYIHLSYNQFFIQGYRFYKMLFRYCFSASRN